MLTVLLENCEKSAGKHDIEKPILLYFWNVPTKICLELSEESHFHYRLVPDTIEFTFLYILVLQKTHLLLKLIFTGTELRQRHKFDTFQKALFFTLVSSTNLDLQTVAIAAGQYLRRDFTFFSNN